MIRHLISLLLVSFLALNSFGQLTQSITGTVIDKQSHYPIPGVQVIISASDPLIGTVTDIDGYFRIDNVDVGRTTIEASFIGYEKIVLSNLLLVSGKEFNINVQLVEEVNSLNEVVIKADIDKRETKNKLATVSTRTFSVEEAGRYAGSLQDPARMAQNFAGVASGSDDKNDIIIRGNSPLGVLWRMEGIDIPSPNHFSTLGNTGGAVSMLNINNLSNSDFMTSAWSADYGNATSGVFDLEMRNGNRDKREYVVQMGFNGLEFGGEGPFKKGGKASYIFNLRYSTLQLFDYVGIDLGVGSAVPEYQDITFKVNVPTKKAGRFTLWGLGGTSNIEFKPSAEIDTTNLYADNNENTVFASNTGVVGLSHTYFFNKSTFSKLVLAASNTGTKGKVDTLSLQDERVNLYGFDRSQTKYSINYKINKKFNAKNTLTTGIIGDQYILDIKDSAYVHYVDPILGMVDYYRIIANNKGNGFLLQSYISWQHKFSNKITLNSGLHSQHFMLSKANALEPRLGLKIRANKKHTLGLGCAMHSQNQPIPIYFNELANDSTNEVSLPNKSLDFTKAIHAVISHDYFIGKNVRLKTELYYQHLYNIPVDPNNPTRSMVNEGAGFALPSGTGYVNSGTGKNYGLELTLEKFLSNGLYYLVTYSLFESKYKGFDKVERNTAFNGTYVLNGLAGKEFTFKNKSSLSFNIRMTYAGGKRYTPIDIEASIDNSRQIEYLDQAYTQRHNPYFRSDFKITFQINKERLSHAIAIDLQNLTNQKNVFEYGYNVRNQRITTVYQRGFLPVVLYKLVF
ncbi:MAG: TonB-dependent receptor [Flavobacteriales bacterium]|nr:TonB-dependent receptor [Flavobacteriales bacterium]